MRVKSGRPHASRGAAVPMMQHVGFQFVATGRALYESDGVDPMDADSAMDSA